MKKHKMEIAALTLLLGVLCYAFYDSNIRGYEEDIDLSSDLLTMAEIKDKSEFTIELLSLPIPEENKQLMTLKELEEAKKEVEVEEEVAETTEDETIADDTTLAEAEVTNEEPVVETYSYQPTYSYIPEYNEDLATQIVNYALQFVGGPYVYGGNSLTNGTDCSGFTKLVFANFGIELERSAPSQIYNGVSVGLSNIKPGDIVLSGYNGSICHSSLYIGNGQLVHALNSSVGIVVTDLYIMPIIDVRRVI